MGCAAVRCFFYEMSARNIGNSAVGGVNYLYDRYNFAEGKNMAVKTNAGSDLTHLNTIYPTA